MASQSQKCTLTRAVLWPEAFLLGGLEENYCSKAQLGE